MSSATGQRVGKYDVMGTLATGPRVRVFRGLDPAAGRSVALKVIGRQHVNAQALPAFRKYTLALSRLEHPGKNHVRLIDAFEQFKQQTNADWLLAFGGSDWHGEHDPIGTHAALGSQQVPTEWLHALEARRPAVPG